MRMIATGAALMLATAATAQDRPVSVQPQAPIDEILVTAPDEKAIDDFIANIGDPVSPKNGYARWD